MLGRAKNANHGIGTHIVASNATDVKNVGPLKLNFSCKFRQSFNNELSRRCFRRHNI